MGTVWQDFLRDFGSGPMSGGLYVLLTLGVRLPMRLASRMVARLDTNMTNGISAPLLVTLVGNVAVWLLLRFVPEFNAALLYGAVSTAGLTGLMERHVVAPVTAKADVHMDKSAVFVPGVPPKEGE